jgi:hypothetical protein
MSDTTPTLADPAIEVRSENAGRHYVPQALLRVPVAA